MKRGAAFFMACLLAGLTAAMPVSAAVEDTEVIEEGEENTVAEEDGLPVTEESTAVPDSEENEIAGFEDSAGPCEEETAERPRPGAYVEGEALVVWKNGDVTAGQDKSMEKAENLPADFQIETLMDVQPETSGGIAGRDGGSSENAVISLVSSDNYSTEEIVDIMNDRQDVEIAEPNYLCYSLSMDLNDTYSEYLWSLDNNGNGQSQNTASLHAKYGWEKEKSSDPIVVAVLDTGVNYNHPDLADRMWHNTLTGLMGEYGYDFANNDSDPADDVGHGSHCAGIIAAQANNGEGVAGVSGDANVQIMALKFLSSSGEGNNADAIAAYDYMARAVQGGVNLAAVNNSWGSTAYSLTFDRAMDLLGEKGVLSVNAGGNDGRNNDEAAANPSNSQSPYAVAVAATREDGGMASYSNYGKKEVDVLAPGTNILSTVSAPNFLPAIYGEARDGFTAQYREFSQDTSLIQISESSDGLKRFCIQGGTSDNVSGAGGFSQVWVSDGELSIADRYIGDRVNEAGGTKASLCWTIHAQENKVYNLALPVTGSVSGSSWYNLVWNSVTQQEEDAAAVIKSVQFQEEQGKLKIAAGGKYGTGCSRLSNDIFRTNEVQAAGSQSGAALGLSVTAKTDGVLAIYLDSAGISNPQLSHEEFGCYDLYSGTSMATPAVTGAAALLSAVYPEMDALALRDKLLSMTSRENGANEVVSAGAVDFDFIDMENPVVTQVSVKNKSVVIKGSGFGSDAGIVLAAAQDGEPEQVEAEDWSDSEIVIGYNEDWNCHDFNLSIKTADSRQVTYRTYLITGKKKFKKLQTAYDLEKCYFGYAASDGKDLYYYYADEEGDALLSFDGEMETLIEIPWEELLEEAGFDEYNRERLKKIEVFDYSCCVKNQVYLTTYIEAGFDKQMVILSYNPSKKTWNAWGSRDYPAYLEKVEFVRIAVYDGDLYYLGGSFEDSSYSGDMAVFRIADKKWKFLRGGLPQGKAADYGAFGQWGDSLYLMLGADEAGNLDRNVYAYDGSKWTVTGQIPKPAHGITSVSGAQNYEAAHGICRNGIILSGVTFPGYGDTVIYNLEKNALEATDYNLYTRVNDNVTRGAVCGKYFYTLSLQGNDMIMEMARMPVDNIVYVTSLKLSKTTATVKPGKTLQLKAVVTAGADNQTVTWKSSNTSYAAVDANGKVTAKKAGNGKTVTITAVAADRGTVKATCRIKIEYPVTRIQIQKSARYIKAGQKMTLKVTITPSNATNKKVTWKSSNTKYATVNSKGVVTAKKAGIGKSVKIYATASNGKTNYRLLKIKK